MKSLFRIFMFVSLVAIHNLSVAASDSSDCDIYPIGLSANLLQGASVEQHFSRIFSNNKTEGFDWLSWTGNQRNKALKNSLLPPGNVSSYINPNDVADRVLNSGDWVNSISVSSAGIVKRRLRKLVGKDIIVPIWDMHDNYSVNHYGNFGYLTAFKRNFNWRFINKKSM